MLATVLLLSCYHSLHLYGSSIMPFVRDIPTCIPVPGVSLHLICVDVNRAAPLLYLAHESPSGLQVYTAELAWSYLVTPSVPLLSSSSISVNLSAPGSVVTDVASDLSGAGSGSSPPTRR